MTSPDSLWPAPTSTAIDARVHVPGSKSQNNRELVLAALAEEPTTLTGALQSRDSDLMVDALRALGAEIVVEGTTVTVTPGPVEGPAEIDCGLACTVMRFVPPIAALASGEITLAGDPHARGRPLAPVLNGLTDLGVQVPAPAGQEPPTDLPVTVHGEGGLAGGEVEVEASASSQFVSSLRLAAPRYTRGLLVRHVGERSPSVPHIVMTVDALSSRGVWVESGQNERSIHLHPLRGGSVAIAPDISTESSSLS